MRTTFFVPRGESCPIKPGHVIAGRLVIDQFVGNVNTPSHIGYGFTVRSMTFQERMRQVAFGDIGARLRPEYVGQPAG